MESIYALCMMALCVWREARGEPTLAKLGVIFTILARVSDGKKWNGSDIVSVITTPWQFSSMTDPKDPQLTKFPRANDSTFIECWKLCEDVLNGKIANCIGTATHYHDVSIKQPTAWGNKVTFIVQYGKLRFYRVED